MKAPGMVIRHCDGGEQVNHGRTSSLCSYCSNGRCLTAQACGVPEPEPAARRRFLSTPEARGRAVGAGLGLAGAAWITAEVLAYLGIF